MKKHDKWKDIDYITSMFFNDNLLKRRAKQIIEIDTTNDWGFNGVKSIKYIMPNGSSYENKSINNNDRGIHEQFYIFKIKNKEVSKEEWLKHNKIKRLTSVKGWQHSVYDGKFDNLINDYINYKI